MVLAGRANLKDMLEFYKNVREKTEDAPGSMRVLHRWLTFL